MQSNDYQLDRAFYYACRDDRERLCGMVAAGNGRVYRCLYSQVKNSLMSGAVRTFRIDLFKLRKNQTFVLLL